MPLRNGKGVVPPDYFPESFSNWGLESLNYPCKDLSKPSGLSRFLKDFSKAFEMPFMNILAGQLLLYLKGGPSGHNKASEGLIKPL